MSLLKTRSKLKKAGPLWQGPTAEGPLGGVTQSMLVDWSVCRERARIKYLEGLKPIKQFDTRIEFGNMWHICEEAHAANEFSDKPLAAYCKQLSLDYRNNHSDIEKWYNVVKRQFPIYVNYWRKQPDVKNRTPFLQEKVFDIPYTLPSGRIVRLRGKFDAVDLIGKSDIYLQENKSKGQINPVMMRKQLVYDLQTMLYLVALREAGQRDIIPFPTSNCSVKGVRYNVIRRPLSGGKHTIVQKQGSRNVPAETAEEYYDRLAGLIEEECKIALKTKQDCFYFMRWKVEVYPSDIVKFEEQTLIPVLEQLCDWYDYLVHGIPPVETGFHIHYQMPFGVYSPLLDDGSTNYDDYLMSGNQAGLEKVTTLFDELQ